MQSGSDMTVIHSRQIIRTQSYKVEFGVLPENLHLLFNEWKWVEGKDLLKTVNAILHSFHHRQFFGAVEILSTFALLNKKIRDRGYVTWVNGLKYVLHGEELPKDQFEFFLIPEPWADVIVWAVSQGIVSIGLRPPQDVGGGRKIWDLEARFHDGMVKWLHWQGGYKYRIID